jgi:hypothetical protein
MDRANDDANPSPPERLATRLFLANPLPPRLTSLLRALELAPIHGLGVDRLDVERVEALWEMLEVDSTAHGFVLARRDGRRCYLQYIAAYDEDDVTEDVLTLPMGGERYPRFNSSGGVVWDDEVEDLNRLLLSA